MTGRLGVGFSSHSETQMHKSKHCHGSESFPWKQRRENWRRGCQGDQKLHQVLSPAWTWHTLKTVIGRASLLNGESLVCPGIFITLWWLGRKEDCKLQQNVLINPLLFRIWSVANQLFWLLNITQERGFPLPFSLPCSRGRWQMRTSLFIFPFRQRAEAKRSTATSSKAQTPCHQRQSIGRDRSRSNTGRYQHKTSKLQGHQGLTQTFCHTNYRKCMHWPRKEWDKEEEAITWNEKIRSQDNSYTEVVSVKQKWGFKEGIVNHEARGIREVKTKNHFALPIKRLSPSQEVWQGNRGKAFFSWPWGWFQEQAFAHLELCKPQAVSQCDSQVENFVSSQNWHRTWLGGERFGNGSFQA